MLRLSLKAKLGLAWVGMLVMLGLTVFVVARQAATYYFQEVNQTLNASVGMYVVERLTLMKDGAVDREQFALLADQAMTVNPSVEVYLLDPQGRVLAHALPEETVVLDSVDTKAIQSFLDGSEGRPILGQDPRLPGARKSFSAAAIEHDGALQGYLYVVLGGRLFDQVSNTLMASFIGKVAAAGLVVVLVAGIFIGWVVLRRLVQPLEMLRDGVQKFTASGFKQRDNLAQVPDGLREVAELKQEFRGLTDALQEAFAQIETTDRLRRELVAHVSHDLRTPLSSMQGYLETLLIKDDTLTPDERRQSLHIAHAHTKQLGRLISELFELAKLDAGAVEPCLETFSLKELSHDVVQEFQLSAREKNVSLAVLDAQTPEEDITVVGDIGLIQRVFENLLNNALRYTPEGGAVHIELQPASESVQVAVADNGSGIEAARLPTVFDSFNGAQDAQGEQSGLGLAIVKRLLALHGADIEVISSPGNGTRFIFELPTDLRAAA